jgi:stringent starvation protein B
LHHGADCDEIILSHVFTLSAHPFLMTSSRPYLIRAMYQWIVDNGTTPHLLVDIASEAVQVPRRYGENGKIVLNIGPTAVQGLTLGNTTVTFSARFGGKPTNVVVPVESIIAIYTRENGQGMMFGEDEPQPPALTTGKAKPTKPRLKLIK